MSHLEEVRLMEVRGWPAPIKERLLDIEARLAAAKATDTGRPAKISLREVLVEFVRRDTASFPWGHGHWEV
jgi:hypothetical protein